MNKVTFALIVLSLLCTHAVGEVHPWIEYYKSDRFFQRYRIMNGFVYTETVAIIRTSPEKLIKALQGNWKIWWKKCDYNNRQEKDGFISYVKFIICN
jgi:hypothetical protein